MLSEIHFLLTYRCNFECDHCFLYCGPDTPGTFTIAQVEEVLNEAQKIGTIKMVYFEGGEPTLYYPLLLESVKRAHQKGFEVGIVTNAYGALAEEDAHLWLDPLAQAGLSVLSVSDDTFHYGGERDNPALTARKVGRKLKLNAFPICIDPPEILELEPDQESKGHSLVGGGAKFRGRAADKLTAGLPTRSWKVLKECPYEDLVSPNRVHLDAYGEIQICQGISIGNFWNEPLSEIMAAYDPEKHPICGPLIRGGPAGLIEEVGLDPDPGYVDECHACFSIRRRLLDRFPEHLTPRQVYGRQLSEGDVL